MSITGLSNNINEPLIFNLNTENNLRIPINYTYEEDKSNFRNVDLKIDNNNPNIIRTIYINNKIYLIKAYNNKIILSSLDSYSNNENIETEIFSDDISGIIDCYGSSNGTYVYISLIYKIEDNYYANFIRVDINNLTYIKLNNNNFPIVNYNNEDVSIINTLGRLINVRNNNNLIFITSETTVTIEETTTNIGHLTIFNSDFEGNNLNTINFDYNFNNYLPDDISINNNGDLLILSYFNNNYNNNHIEIYHISNTLINIVEKSDFLNLNNLNNNLLIEQGEKNWSIEEITNRNIEIEEEKEIKFYIIKIKSNTNNIINIIVKNDEENEYLYKYDFISYSNNDYLIKTIKFNDNLNIIYDKSNNIIYLTKLLRNNISDFLLDNNNILIQKDISDINDTITDFIQPVYYNDNIIPLYLIGNNNIYLYSLNNLTLKNTYNNDFISNNYISINNELLLDKDNYIIYEIINQNIFCSIELISDSIDKRYLKLDLVNNEININYSYLTYLYDNHADKTLKFIFNYDNNYNYYIKLIRNDFIFINNKNSEFFLAIELNNYLNNIPTDIESITKYLLLNVKTSDEIINENDEIKIVKDNSNITNPEYTLTYNRNNYKIMSINKEVLNTYINNKIKEDKNINRNLLILTYLNNYMDACENSYKDSWNNSFEGSNNNISESFNNNDLNNINYYFVFRWNQSLLDKEIKVDNNTITFKDYILSNYNSYYNEKFIYRINLLVQCGIYNNNTMSSSSLFTNILNNNDLYYYLFNKNKIYLSSYTSLYKNNITANIYGNNILNYPSDDFTMNKVLKSFVNYYIINNSKQRIDIKDDNNDIKFYDDDITKSNYYNALTLVKGEDIPITTKYDLNAEVNYTLDYEIIPNIFLGKNIARNFYINRKSFNILTINKKDITNLIINPTILVTYPDNENQYIDFQINNYINVYDNGIKQIKILDQCYKYKLYDSKNQLIGEYETDNNDNIIGNDLLMNQVNSRKLYHIMFHYGDFKEDDFYIFELDIQFGTSWNNNESYIPYKKTFVLNKPLSDVENNKFFRKVGGTTSYIFRNNGIEDPITIDGTGMINKYNSLILRIDKGNYSDNTIQDIDNDNHLTNPLYLNRINYYGNEYYLDGDIQIIMYKKGHLSLESFYNNLEETRKTDFQYKPIRGNQIKLNDDNIDEDTKISQNYLDNDKKIQPIKTEVDLSNVIDTDNISDYINRLLYCNNSSNNSNLSEEILNSKFIAYCPKNDYSTDGANNNTIEWKYFNPNIITPTLETYLNFYYLSDPLYEFMVYNNGELIFNSINRTENSNNISSYCKAYNFIKDPNISIIFKSKINYTTFTKNYTNNISYYNNNLESTIRIFELPKETETDIFNSIMNNNIDNEVNNPTIITKERDYTTNYNFISSHHSTDIKIIPCCNIIDTLLTMQIKIYKDDNVISNIDVSGRLLEKANNLINTENENNLNVITEDFCKNGIIITDITENCTIKVEKIYYMTHNYIKNGMGTLIKNGNIINTDDDNFSKDNFSFSTDDDIELLFTTLRPEYTKRYNNTDTKFYYINYLYDLDNKGINIEKDEEDTIVYYPKLKFLNENMQYDYIYSFNNNDDTNYNKNYVLEPVGTDNYKIYMNYSSTPFGTYKDEENITHKRNFINTVYDKDIIVNKVDNEYKVEYNSIIPQIPYIDNIKNNDILKIDSSFLLNVTEYEGYNYKYYLYSNNKLIEYNSIKSTSLLSFIEDKFKIVDSIPYILIISVYDNKTGLYNFNSYYFTINSKSNKKYLNIINKDRDRLIPYTTDNNKYEHPNELVVNKGTGDIYITSDTIDETGNYPLINLTSNIIYDNLEGLSTSLETLDVNSIDNINNSILNKKMINNDYENYRLYFENNIDKFELTNNINDEIININNNINDFLNTYSKNSIIMESLLNDVIDNSSNSLTLSEDNINRVESIINTYENLKNGMENQNIKELLLSNLNLIYKTYSFANEIKFNIKRLEYEASFKIDKDIFTSWKNNEENYYDNLRTFLINELSSGNF